MLVLKLVDGVLQLPVQHHPVMRFAGGAWRIDSSLTTNHVVLGLWATYRDKCIAVGDSGWLAFNVRLDGPDTRPLGYTNTVTITTTFCIVPRKARIVTDTSEL